MRKCSKEHKSCDQTIATFQQQLLQLSLQVQKSNACPARPGATTIHMAPPTATTIATTAPRNPPMQGWQACQPYTPLSWTQILERAASIPQCPNKDAGKHQYEQDVETWHTTHGQTFPSLEWPYLLKPRTAPLDSGEYFRCDVITEPSHTTGTCMALESLRPHESC